VIFPTFKVCKYSIITLFDLYANLFVIILVSKEQTNNAATLIFAADENFTKLSSLVVVRGHWYLKDLLPPNERPELDDTMATLIEVDLSIRGKGILEPRMNVNISYVYFSYLYIHMKI
jgi:hypothetical protein